MMAETPYQRRDFGHHAHHRKPPAEPVGSHPAGDLPPDARRARIRGPPTRRPSLLRALPGALRPGLGQALDPDRDLPADDVPEAPLPPRLRAALPGGGRLDHLDPL